MNILFLTIGRIENINSHAIYTDLLRCFRDQGHNVYTVSPLEKRKNKETYFAVDNGVHTLKVRTGNITKCPMIEKGISTLLIESQYIAAIKKYLSDVKFDLIIYSTPPITFVRAVEFVKRRDNAKTYLLLKDIFPQNAVDLGIMGKKGLKSLIYRYFRMKEKRLYAISDTIGCMSQANCDYLLHHNPKIDPSKVEICPNSIEIMDVSVTAAERDELRRQYGIPLDKKVFVYGGNLGRPHAIPFIIECLEKLKENKDAFFLIVGDGTEFEKIEKYINENKPSNVKQMKRLPKEVYDCMISACDWGLIFLDHRFTIPNFPSRLLVYLQASLPVISCTDTATDIGTIIAENSFGFKCESNDTDAFVRCVNNALSVDTEKMGKKGFEYLKENYTVDKAYDIIMKRVSE